MPLRTQEIAIVERVRSAGTAEYLAVREVAGIDLPNTPSEAESLHALLQIGIAAVEEKVMTNGYAALAASRNDEDHATTAAIRSRGAAYRD